MEIIQNGDRLIVMDNSRYEELLATEEKARLMEKAIAGLPNYGEYEAIKRVFVTSLNEGKEIEK